MRGYVCSYKGSLFVVVVVFWYVVYVWVGQHIELLAFSPRLLWVSRKAVRRCLGRVGFLTFRSWSSAETFSSLISCASYTCFNSAHQSVSSLLFWNQHLPLAVLPVFCFGLNPLTPFNKNNDFFKKLIHGSKVNSFLSSLKIPLFLPFFFKIPPVPHYSNIFSSIFRTLFWNGYVSS